MSVIMSRNDPTTGNSTGRPPVENFTLRYYRENIRMKGMQHHYHPGRGMIVQYPYKVDWHQFKACVISVLDECLKKGSNALLGSFLAKFREIPESDHRNLALYLQVAFELDKELCKPIYEKMIPGANPKFHNNLYDSFAQFQYLMDWKNFCNKIKEEEQPVFKGDWIHTVYVHTEVDSEKGTAGFYFKNVDLFWNVLENTNAFFKITDNETKEVASGLQEELGCHELLAKIREEVKRAALDYFSGKKFVVKTIESISEDEIFKRNLIDISDGHRNDLSTLSEKIAMTILQEKFSNESDSSTLTRMVKAAAKEGVSVAEQEYIDITTKAELTDAQKTELTMRLFEAVRIKLIKTPLEKIENGPKLLEIFLLRRSGEKGLYCKEFYKHFEQVISGYLNEINFTNRTDYVLTAVSESYTSIREAYCGTEGAKKAVTEAIVAAAEEFFRQNPRCVMRTNDGKLMWTKGVNFRFYESSSESAYQRAVDSAAEIVIKAYKRAGIVIQDADGFVEKIRQEQVTCYVNLNACNQIRKAGN